MFWRYKLELIGPPIEQHQSVFNLQSILKQPIISSILNRAVLVTFVPDRLKLTVLYLAAHQIHLFVELQLIKVIHLLSLHN